jgi:hypothetical protein
VRHWITPSEGLVPASHQNAIGVQFYGSGGYLAVDSYNSYKTLLGPEQKSGPERNRGGNHFANFIEAVRSRRREMLHAEIEEGATSDLLVHLANISYRVGRSIAFDPSSMNCKGDDEANRLLTRDYREPFVVPAEV